MSSLNENLRSVVASDEVFRRDNNMTAAAMEETLLGVQEAVVKMWADCRHGTRETMGRRAANLIYGALLAVKSAGIDDIDSALKKRLEEINSTP